MSIDREAVARWLDDYVAAWNSYDRESIVALFSDAAAYRYHPYDDEITGSGSIADSWLADRDQQGRYDAVYEPYAIDGDRAVVTGTSTYTAADGSVEQIFDNCFLMRFDRDGRCAEFTEFFVRRPD